MPTKAARKAAPASGGRKRAKKASATPTTTPNTGSDATTLAAAPAPVKRAAPAPKKPKSVYMHFKALLAESRGIKVAALEAAATKASEFAVSILPCCNSVV